MPSAPASRMTKTRWWIGSSVSFGMVVALGAGCSAGEESVDDASPELRQTADASVDARRDGALVDAASPDLRRNTVPPDLDALVRKVNDCAGHDMGFAATFDVTTFDAADIMEHLKAGDESSLGGNCRADHEYSTSRE